MKTPPRDPRPPASRRRRPTKAPPPAAAARRGRPPRIDRDAIIAAGLEIGIARATMRDVAAKLGVTDAALYHHFPGRDALLAAMVDALAERFELPRAAADWRRFLRSFAYRLRASVLAAPGSAVVLATLGPATPGTRRIVETVVHRLVDSGFDVASAALAYSLVTTYVVTSAAREEGHPDIGSFGSERLTGRGRSPLAAPSPLFASVLAAWRSRSWDQHYAYGIETLLDGIASRRSRSSKRARCQRADT